MAEKKSNNSKIFTKENFFATLLGASSFKDWARSEGGKIALEKMSSRMFGVGPEDEALFRKAINYLLDEILKLDRKTQIEERKNLDKKITQFLVYLKTKGWSTWWFRNVLATMRKGDAEGENQAAQTLANIIEGKDFNEMVEIAGPDLIHKSYKKKISEGWEIVVGKGGQMIFLFDRSKISNFIQPKIETAKKDFKRGFVQTFLWFWGSIGTLVIIFFLFVLFSN